LIIGLFQTVVKAQACWRRWLAVRAFRAIRRGDMSLPTLRRFLHLLDIGQRDYDEEVGSHRAGLRRLELF